MAQISSSRNTNTVPAHKQPIFSLRSGLVPFISACAGVGVGLIAALAVVVPMVHSEFASQAAQLNHQLVAMAPAAGFQTAATCVQPIASGHVLGSTTTAAKTISAAHGGGKGGAVLPHQVFVTKLIGGVFANTKASISNTGPESTNSIKTTNIAKTTVTNTNNIVVSSTNSQSAASGDATSKQNTSGGSAVSGAAANTNTTTLSFVLNN